jgi:hypothetical protein
MFSVILYMFRQTLRRRVSPLPFPSFSPSYCDVSQARSYFASTVLELVLSVSVSEDIISATHQQTCYIRSPLSNTSQRVQFVHLQELVVSKRIKRNALCHCACWIPTATGVGGGGTGKNMWKKCVQNFSREFSCKETSRDTNKMTILKYILKKQCVCVCVCVCVGKYLKLYRIHKCPLNTTLSHFQSSPYSVF